jgi:hypothetical protein
MLPRINGPGLLGDGFRSFDALERERRRHEYRRGEGALILRRLIAVMDRARLKSRDAVSAIGAHSRNSLALGAIIGDGWAYHARIRAVDPQTSAMPRQPSSRA